VISGARMEKVLHIAGIEKRYVVDVQFANREQRQAIVAKGATDCCAADVKQLRICKDCGKEVSGTPVRKKIVIGKEERIVSSAVLKRITDALNERTEAVVHTILDTLPDDAIDRYDRLLYVRPAKKREGQYAELAALFAGRVGVGKIVINGYEYEFLLTTGSDHVVRLRLLLESSQMHASPHDVPAPAKGAVAAFATQLLSKQVKTAYDFTAFVDTRNAMVEQLIEQALLSGSTDVPEVDVVDAASDAEELERLKRLAERIEVNDE
jgi:hypothetical protein